MAQARRGSEPLHTPTLPTLPAVKSGNRGNGAGGERGGLANWDKS